MTIRGFLSLESHLLVVLLPFFPGWKCPAGLETQGVQSAEPAGGRQGGVGREVCSLFLKEKAREVRVRRLELAQGPRGVMFPPACVQVDLSQFTKCWRSVSGSAPKWGFYPKVSDLGSFQDKCIWHTKSLFLKKKKKLLLKYS